MTRTFQMVYLNANGPVMFGGYGLLSQRFVWAVPQSDPKYLVYADTLKYRADGIPHPLDLREP